MNFIYLERDGIIRLMDPKVHFEIYNHFEEVFNEERERRFEGNIGLHIKSLPNSNFSYEMYRMLESETESLSESDSQVSSSELEKINESEYEQEVVPDVVQDILREISPEPLREVPVPVPVVPGSLPVANTNIYTINSYFNYMREVNKVRRTPRRYITGEWHRKTPPEKSFFKRASYEEHFMGTVSTYRTRRRRTT